MGTWGSLPSGMVEAWSQDATRRWDSELEAWLEGPQMGMHRSFGITLMQKSPLEV